MGLTFLLLGIGFANPFSLVVSFPRGIWEGNISREALNLYALTVFLGWGHFFYAWQGQWCASKRFTPFRSAAYWCLIVLLLSVLIVLRGILGVGVFSLITWVYNIAHFIKAETFFSGTRVVPARNRSYFSMPAVAFAWFTLALFQTGPLEHTKLVFTGSIALGAIALVTGGWRSLAAGDVRLPLLTLFLLGETMVWSAYDATPAFRVGVYVMHVAAASFFHYLGGYFFAQRTKPQRGVLSPVWMIAVSALFVILGCMVARVPTLRLLRFVLAPEWFTLWVALHLAASDLMPWWKSRQS